MSGQNYRIARDSHSSRIDRTQSIRFRYDNQTYTGHPGDTLASALLANGVRVVGRSFKYHRPRGIYSAGSEEPNALVQLGIDAYTEPNRRATEVEIYEGLQATSQNCWPSVNFDLGAVSSVISGILPAGFYYKTFMWPASLWMTYEKFIRRAAGLGKSPTENDADFYDKTYAHCDVLVIGGGPAGIQAALAAGGAGARVMLVDDKNEFGGALLGENAEINHNPAMQWVEDGVAKLSEMANITLLSRTTVTGYYDYNFLVASERVGEHLGPTNAGKSAKERLWKIRAKQVVHATGAIERPLVFADSDRPGVMLASAINTYINRFSVLPGNHILLVTNNDSAYQTAITAAQVGATVTVIDVRVQASATLAEKARASGVRIIENATVCAVKYASGMIKGARFASLNSSGTAITGTICSLNCDLIGVSGGWNPTVHLFSQSKGKLRYREDLHCFVPANPSANNPLFVAGACQGVYDLKGVLKEGFEAGMAAADALGLNTEASVNSQICGEYSVDPAVNSPADFPANSPADSPSTHTEPLRPLWILPCHHPIGQGSGKHFHELHNDSTVADIHLAAREGYVSVEHLKRYTTTGMGTDQGKTSNLNALTVMAEIQGVTVPQVGTTTFRPPYTPLTLGCIVGHDRRELFLQKRKTAMHAWHDQYAAGENTAGKNAVVYEDVGDWKRPWYFPQTDKTQTNKNGVGEDMHTAAQRETLAVRQTCGLLDASTLGKIDIQGADSVWLLNMLYTNAWNQLAPGKCRYGVMLNEHGMIFDDGVTTCLRENHYHMTTTSGGAARVLGWIEEWLQTEWPEKQVYATSVTEQWAVASLNGPNARRVLEKLTDLPLDDAAFPFMSMRETTVAGIPARIYRISFTGELAFEINVPARFGTAVWQAIMQAGAEFAICPYGTEAMHILRCEVGFIIVGQDTDGTVTPMDVGMDWIVSKKKTDFLGARSHSRTDNIRAGRKQLVGLTTENPEFVLPEGAHVVEHLTDKPPMKMLGHISSSYMSPNVGRSIAFALIKDGFNRIGQTLYVPLMDGRGGFHKVTVTDTVFLKPDQHE